MDVLNTEHPARWDYFGFDRLVAILGGQETIRDFIAFQNNSGRCYD